VVGRKYLVTMLFECPDCKLKFRVPKEDPAVAKDFYQEAYQEGFTTEMPSPAALAGLLQRKFIGSEKDYSTYIDVCRAAGLRENAVILDFGCSWGYGSWQLREAGFRVFSYEVSRARADYAKNALGCEMVEDLASLAGDVDCLFSAHVIEHLPDPTMIVSTARVILAPSGIAITFCPNGDTSSSWSNHYSDLWGKHHPSVITPGFLQRACDDTGLSLRTYSDPYDFRAIYNEAVVTSLPGEELCAIMRRSGRSDFTNHA
jgi:hypothetical protein